MITNDRGIRDLKHEIATEVCKLAWAGRLNDEEFETRAELAISPQFFGWLFALGPDIRVTSPGYVVNKLREYGENVMRYYQQP